MRSRKTDGIEERWRVCGSRSETFLLTALPVVLLLRCRFPSPQMYNGRMAMGGLIMLIATSTASGKDILEVVDIGTGGLLGH